MRPYTLEIRGDGWMDGWIDRWDNIPLISGWMDETIFLVNKWMDGWIDEIIHIPCERGAPREDWQDKPYSLWIHRRMDPSTSIHPSTYSEEFCLIHPFITYSWGIWCHPIKRNMVHPSNLFTRNMVSSLPPSIYSQGIWCHPSIGWWIRPYSSWIRFLINKGMDGWMTPYSLWKLTWMDRWISGLMYVFLVDRWMDETIYL